MRGRQIFHLPPQPTERRDPELFCAPIHHIPMSSCPSGPGSRPVRVVAEQSGPKLVLVLVLALTVDETDPGGSSGIAGRRTGAARRGAYLFRRARLSSKREGAHDTASPKGPNKGGGSLTSAGAASQVRFRSAWLLLLVVVVVAAAAAAAAAAAMEEID
jgi:hypothetical protein